MSSAIERMVLLFVVAVTAAVGWEVWKGEGKEARPKDASLYSDKNNALPAADFQTSFKRLSGTESMRPKADLR